MARILQWHVALCDIILLKAFILKKKWIGAPKNVNHIPKTGGAEFDIHHELLTS